MNFLPVAHLEMRTAARKPITYYSRCMIGFVALGAGLGFEIAGFNRALSASSAGQTVFELLAASGYILLAIQATLLTCDCVSWEKREGTLGLLFLTDLNGFDVVAGKLTAQTSRSLYGLLAALPAFGFCIVLGGVGLLDFLKVAFALLNTLFYFATLGVLISTYVWRERSAAVCGGLSVLVLGVMFPALGLAAGANPLLALVPGGAMLAALAPVLGLTSPPPFTSSLLVSNAAAWLFVAVAALLLRRSWTTGARHDPAPLIRTAGEIQSPAAVARSRKTKSGNLALTIGMMVATCTLGTSVAMLATQKWLVAGATIVLVHWILKFQAISLSTRLLAGRRRSGELEMLLTTPCDEDEIIHGSLVEIKDALLWPTWFALAIDAAALIVGWYSLGFIDGVPWAFVVFGEVIWAVLNLFSLAWTGLYFGLKLANPTSAAVSTSFWVILFPWLASAAVAGFAALASPAAVRSGALVGPFAFMFVIFIIAGNTAVMGLAIGELRDRFRAIVTETWRPK